jgi:hypothetical protein
LPLLVARIVADHVHHAAAAHNFAVVAQAFDTGADFHNPNTSATRSLKARRFFDKSARAESLSVYGLAHNLFKASERRFFLGF